MLKQDCRYSVLNTWNGGAGGRVVVFTSDKFGNLGHNECFEWIQKHTTFSFYEAVTHQGYKIEPWDKISRPHLNIRHG
jgi:hypothetical protein